MAVIIIAYMQWLIVGLGNPGQRYDNTRHNAGFLAVDAIARMRGWNWEYKSSLEAMIAGQREVALLKPDTFMNNSGRSLRKSVDYYKILLEKLIVIHDDLDLPLSQTKVSWARGPHIHNGILSVEQNLKSKLFWRVRVGVDSRTAEERRVLRGERYVLKPLSYEERKLLDKGVVRATEIVEDIMRGRYANGFA
jgi:PTH1 family peptidyl-tRNA hydrolase